LRQNFQENRRPPRDQRRLSGRRPEDLGKPIPNLVNDAPSFEGRAAIAMAREVYGIRDPADRRLTLF
jgi:hypothetical protein